MIRFIAGLIWGHEPQTLQNPLAGKEVRMGGLVLGMEDVAIIIVTVLLTWSLYVFFSRTKLGLAMQGASQNQLAAYYMGIPVRRVQGWVWALAGGVAGIAGILFAAKGAVDPTTGLLGIKAFAAAVIGGFGSLPGALAGGLISVIICCVPLSRGDAQLARLDALEREHVRLGELKTRLTESRERLADLESQEGLVLTLVGLQ